MLPFATTKVTIQRPSVSDADPDGYPDVEATYTAFATGIRAVLTSPSRTSKSGGRSVREGSTREEGFFKLQADPCPLLHTDRVLDETTQTVYRVEWLSKPSAFGLDHVVAGMTLIQGYNL